MHSHVTLLKENDHNNIKSVNQQLAGSPLLDYPTYMARFLASEQPSPLPSPHLNSTETSPTNKFLGEGQTDWVNALIGRIFLDFLREKYWADIVSRKIQRKLSRITLPYFMNELTLTELDMGSCLPQITSASRPVIKWICPDDEGLKITVNYDRL
uniref:Testis expressed 2, like n=1 Tax=Salmo trutta TaxID=8032 RepID=A0A673WC61_SALTR